VPACRHADSLPTARPLPADCLTLACLPTACCLPAPAGADVRVRHGSEFTVERIGFATKVNNLEEARACIQRVLAARA
jgi:hypothetical protein